MQSTLTSQHDVQKLRQFRELCFSIDGVLLSDEETNRVRECSVTLSGSVKRDMKKDKLKYFIDRDFMLQDNDTEPVSDCFEERTLEQALQSIYVEKENMEFSAGHRICQYRKYWYTVKDIDGKLYLDKRVLCVEDGKVILWEG